MKLIKNSGSMIFFRVCEMDYIAAISNDLQWKKGHRTRSFAISYLRVFDVKKIVTFIQIKVDIVLVFHAI